MASSQFAGIPRRSLYHAPGLGLAWLLGWLACSGAAVHGQDSNIDFNRQIRPLLASRCLSCHGPDPEHRSADLRLDTFEGATDYAIVPGEPESSEVWMRISADDPDLVMPPVDSGKTPLTAEEKVLVRAWIEQGADYERHWAFVPPSRPSPPSPSHPDQSPANAIDAFVQARLSDDGLEANPVADRAVLARRVALDLTGLPPEPDALQRFLQDSSPEAYSNYVDQLLESPAFGEHWASYWLDLARYADTDGYADDYPRTIWPYRDWVIQAINQDLPFDQFTIQQLAGDLLPNADERSRVATGFHRNTLTNNEGGTIDEEFRIEAVKDRVDTTMQVWNGLTFGCAKCHTHKYDPISQEDYYRLFAIFNQTADADRPGNPPFQKTYSLGVAGKAKQLQNELENLKKQQGTASPEFVRALSQWKATWSETEAWHPLAIRQAHNDADSRLEIDASKRWVSANGPNPDKASYQVVGRLAERDAQPMTAIRMDVIPGEPMSSGKTVGRSAGNGNFVVSELEMDTRIDAPAVEGIQQITLRLPGPDRMIHLAEIQVLDANQKRLPRSTMQSVQQSSTGFGGVIERAFDGNTDGQFDHQSVSHTAVESDPWIRITFAEPQSISRIVLYPRTDGELYRRLDGLIVQLSNSEQEILWRQVVKQMTSEPTRLSMNDWRPVPFAFATADFEQGLSAASPTLSRATWDAQKMIDGELQVGGWAVSGQQHQPHHAILQLTKPLVVSPEQEFRFTVRQNYGQQHTLASFGFGWTGSPGNHLAIPDDPELAASVFARCNPLGDQVQRAIQRCEEELAALPSANTPVMERLPEQQLRETHLLIKGSWLSPGRSVSPDLPDQFYEAAEVDNHRMDRLALARWLVAPSHPLTGRVTVNRIWARLFGRGIVETEEDFGTMGSPPSHPQLLDWLAVHFVDDLHWSRKALIREMVHSHTYRQSAVVSETAQDRDPENRLLSRAPRFRLSAEQIRDQALVLGGLLNREMYGPSVVPRLPVKELGSAFSGRTISQSSGDDLYRRGLYTFVRRTGPYPTVLTFDGTNRQVCTVRRIRTNTPLQALVTLNDPVFFEAAQGLGRRVAKYQQTLATGEQESVPQAVSWAFRVATCRDPDADERKALVTLFQQQHTKYQGQQVPLALLEDPIGPLPESWKTDDHARLAAWTVVANVILNLDEVLTR